MTLAHPTKQQQEEEEEEEEEEDEEGAEEAVGQLLGHVLEQAENFSGVS